MGVENDSMDSLSAENQKVNQNGDFFDILSPGQQQGQAESVSADKKALPESRFPAVLGNAGIGSGGRNRHRHPGGQGHATENECNPYLSPSLRSNLPANSSKRSKGRRTGSASNQIQA